MMMEEVNEDIVVVSSSISEQLREAALTEVTQADLTPGGTYAGPQTSAGSAVAPPPQTDTSVNLPPSYTPDRSVNQAGLVTSGYTRQYPGLPAAGDVYNAPGFSSPPVVGYNTSITASPPPTQVNTSQPQPPQQPQQPQGLSSTVDLAGADLAGANVGASAPVEESSGLFGGIFAHGGFMEKVVQKTKLLSENVITALDPGMKQVMYNSGLEVIVATDDVVKIAAVRQAFYDVFGRADVYGIPARPSLAVQLVGVKSGLSGAEQCLDILSGSGHLINTRVGVAIQPFIVELLPKHWYEMTCVLLNYGSNSVTTFSQPLIVAESAVNHARSCTPLDYPQAASGYSVAVSSQSQALVVQAAVTEAATQLQRLIMSSS